MQICRARNLDQQETAKSIAIFCESSFVASKNLRLKVQLKIQKLYMNMIHDDLDAKYTKEHVKTYRNLDDLYFIVVHLGCASMDSVVSCDFQDWRQAVLASDWLDVLSHKTPSAFFWKSHQLRQLITCKYLKIKHSYKTIVILKIIFQDKLQLGLASTCFY